MGRSILAVLMGFVITGLLVTGTDQVFSFAIVGFDRLTTLPDYYFVISLVTTGTYCVVGGWTCAAIVRKNIPKHTRILMLPCELAVIALAASLWKSTVPHYFFLALLVLCPLGVQFGSRSFGWTRPEPEKR